MAQMVRWARHAQCGVPVLGLWIMLGCQTGPEPPLVGGSTPANNATEQGSTVTGPIDSDRDDAKAVATRSEPPLEAEQNEPKLSVTLQPNALSVGIERGHAAFTQLKLVLTDAHGRQQTHLFPAANPVELSLSPDGIPLPDGIYKYSLTPLRSLVSGAASGQLAIPRRGESLQQIAQQRLIENTTRTASSLVLDANGRDASKAKPTVSELWSPTRGAFRIEDGQLVLPEEEPEAETPSVSSPTLTEPPSLDQDPGEETPRPVAPAKFESTRSPATEPAGEQR